MPPSPPAASLSTSSPSRTSPPCSSPPASSTTASSPPLRFFLLPSASRFYSLYLTDRPPAPDHLAISLARFSLLTHLDLSDNPALFPSLLLAGIFRLPLRFLGLPPTTRDDT